MQMLLALCRFDIKRGATYCLLVTGFSFLVLGAAKGQTTNGGCDSTRHFPPVRVTSKRSELPHIISWGKYSSHPARKYFDSAPRLSNTDAKLLALSLAKIPFDARRFSKEPAFSQYFREYNKTTSEFEKHRLEAGIQKSIETRQAELSTQCFFWVDVTNTSCTLKDYNFEVNGFPFNYSDRNNEISLEGPRDIDEGFDKSLLPNVIKVDQSSAERILKINPTRQVSQLLIVRPTRAGGTEGQVGHWISFLDLNIIPLAGEGLFEIVFIPKTGEVIGVYPSEESFNGNISDLLSARQEYERHHDQMNINRCDYFLDLRRKWMTELGWNPTK
jgi:hypothetical protein